MRYPIDMPEPERKRGQGGLAVVLGVAMVARVIVEYIAAGSLAEALAGIGLEILTLAAVSVVAYRMGRVRGWHD